MPAPDRRADEPSRLRPSPAAVRDLRGGVRLLFDGVRAGLERLEEARQRLVDVDPPVAGARLGRAVAWGPLVHRGARGTADLVGGALDLALGSLQAALAEPRAGRGKPAPSASRDATVALLNALAGDHLHRTDNPLAIPTAVRVRGDAAQPRVLVLVHDLGLGEAHWRQPTVHHGDDLAAALGASCAYVRYNSGRPVAAVARELAAELEPLLARWPVPLEGIAGIGHGLGGLVLRSALLQASRQGLAWPAHVRHLVFLGTPHHGAPVEAGWPMAGWPSLSQALPARLAGLARRRSAGLSDFAAGRLLEPDPRTGEPPQHATVGLPAGVASHAIAGSVGAGQGDGIVPLDSALGRHPVAAHDLALPEADRWVAQGVDHVGLLGSRAVGDRMRQWLSA